MYGKELCESLNAYDYFLYLFKVSKNQEYYKIEKINNLDTIFTKYEKNIGNSIMEDSFNEFISIYSKKNSSNAISNLSPKIKDKILQEIEKNQSKHFYIGLLSQILIQNFLNHITQSIIQETNHNENHQSEYYKLDTESGNQFGDEGAAYKVCFNQFMNFYLEKTYSCDNKEIIQQEQELFKENISKFIVSPISKTPGNSIKKVYIPYFPNGTLFDVIKEQKQNDLNKLTNSNKIIILLEIGEALKDLHSKGKSHNNLSDKSIYINSKYDGYIGSFFCPLNKNTSVSDSTLYFRSPERILQIESNTDDSPTNSRFNDIYSFGVLMHEIFTDIRPESRMEEKVLNDKKDVLKGNYCEFLFSGEGKEYFEEEGEFEEMKTIIEKCLYPNRSERYQSMSDIIEEIKRTKLYQENKEEIEYRLQNAIDYRKSKCTLADIVVSYLQGKSLSLEIILEFLNEYHNNCIQDEYQIEKIDDVFQAIYDSFNTKIENDVAEEDPEQKVDSFLYIRDGKLIESDIINSPHSFNEIINDKSLLDSISKYCNRNAITYFDCTITIANINSYLEKVDQFVNQHTEEEIAEIKENNKKIREHIIKIKQILPETFIINNIVDLGHKLNLLQNDIDSEFSKEKLTNILSSIKDINQILAEFIRIDDKLKEIQIEILTKIDKGIGVLKIIYGDKYKSKIASSLLKALIFNQIGEPILVFDKTHESYQESRIKQIEKIILDVQNQFNNQFKRVFNNTQYFGTRYYFIKEIDTFSEELKNLINCNQKQSITKGEFDNISAKIKETINEMNSKVIHNLRKSDEYFHYLLNISKSKQNYAISDILYSTESISEIYSNYGGKLIIQDCYNIFVKYYYEKNNKINNINETLISKMVNILKTIKAEKTKYYYIDILFQIILESFLDQNLFKSKFINKKQSDTSEDVNCTLIDENESGNQFSFPQLKYKICINQSGSFYLNKIYECNNDKLNIGLIEKEIEIFKDKYSKFIVMPLINEIICLKDLKKLKVYIPYFPNGTLYNVINDQKQNDQIKLTKTNKIVILLEIGEALKDLHSKGKFHNNLSDNSIYINSKYDGYIGSFFYPSDQLNKKTDSTLYFRSPERILQIESNTDDSQTNSRFNDIYSFGVLMHEIFTDIRPESRMVKKRLNDKKDILKGNYCEFLFSGEGKEYFEEECEFEEMKTIIEKCLYPNRSERYQSMSDIIEEIKRTKLYQENKEEIEYRLSNSIDGRTYECCLSDIFESLYRGQKKSETDISTFILTYQKYFLCNNNPSSLKTTEKDLIEEIYSIFKIKDQTALKYWSRIVDYSHNHEYQNVIGNISLIYNIYKDLIAYSTITKTYNEFISFYNQTKQANTDKTLTNENINEFFEETQKNGKFFYIDILFQFLVKNILYQKVFQQKMRSIMEKADKGLNAYSYLGDTFCFNDFNASNKLNFDSNLLFHISKMYNQNIDKNILKKENEIFSNHFSNHVVCILNEKQEILDSNCNNTQKKIHKTILPYFPIGTIENIIKYQRKNQTYNCLPRSKRRIEFTNVDKIIILLEIAKALNDLDQHEIYHGFLCDQSIFINCKKDAYIGSFCFDKKLDNSGTKQVGPFYTRPPEYFNSDLLNNKSDDEIIQAQKYIDIYSFGVIMHELFTDTTPSSRMGNKSRLERLKIFQGDYCNFLFKGENNNSNDENESFSEHNECFEDHYVDYLGNSLKGVKDIIQKCMQIEAEKRYKSMSQIINAIQQLPLYQKNKEEIKIRLDNATNSLEYQCTISDIVTSYYLGQEHCFNNVEKLLTEIQKMTKSESNVSIIDDVTRNIFSTYNIQLNEGMYLKFDHIFNLIIQLVVNDSIDQSKTNNLNDELLQLSLQENIKNSTSDFVIPISSLKKFIENNQDKMEELSSTFIYLIAKELSIIHANYLYHGELSTDTIGVYYNHTTQTFVPSIILYYSFYKRLKNNEIINQMQTNQKKKKKNKNTTLIEKRQKKEFKNSFKAVVDEILIKSEFIFEPERIRQFFDESETINEYLYHFYQYVIENENDLALLEIDYSALDLTFSSLVDLISNSTKDKEFSFTDSFLNIDLIFDRINQFLDNTIEFPSQKIIENIKRKSTVSSLNNDSKIEVKMALVNQKCFEIFTKINIEKFNCLDNIDVNDSLVDPSLVQLVDFSLPKRISYFEKIAKLKTRTVFRNIEFTYFCRRSFYCLLFRYVHDLMPNIRYKLTIRLNGKNNFDFKQEKFIPLEEVKRMQKIIPRLKQEPTMDEGNIILYVDMDDGY